MKAERTRWFALAVLLGVGLGLLVLCLPGGRARAGDPGGARLMSDLYAEPGAMGQASLLAAAGPPADGGVQTLTGSSVEMDRQCYGDDLPNQILCFTVYNGSTDADFIEAITLTFPVAAGAWPVNWCGYEDPTDSVGYVVNFNCTPAGNQVVYRTADSDGYGEISGGASWEACVNVDVPSGYSAGPRYILWKLEGEKGGKESGSIEINPCGPLVVWPETMELQGCNGVEQLLTFEVWNHHAGPNQWVDLYYPAVGGTFDGPPGFTMSEGDHITFTAQLVPDRCLNPDDIMTAELIAEGGPGEVDSAAITHTVSLFSGWHAQPYTSPVPSMDSVVVWASEDDGGIWVIGGYGSDGATQRYEPRDNTWQTFQSEAAITPLIEYPVDGCYGLNAVGDEIVVLFPDTLVTGSLHIYNITASSWYTEPVPAWYPAIGRWGLDVVSMLNIPASVKPGIANTNVCYLSGGADKPGGGTTRDLWVYYPDDPDAGHYVTPGFPASVWFDFHASWYVPWVGDDGAICIAGGADHNHQITNSTQCYDLATGTFNGLNADLGPLPEPWWGMADGWQIYRGRYRIWMANGVAQDGTLLPISVYADETTGGFVGGPEVPIAMYRGEGTGHDDGFYMMDGSKGGFWYSHSNLLLSQCPWCAEVDLPLILGDN